jgi:hypothetical protein
VPMLSLSTSPHPVCALSKQPASTFIENNKGGIYDELRSLEQTWTTLSCYWHHYIRTQTRFQAFTNRHEMTWQTHFQELCITHYIFTHLVTTSHYNNV